MRRDGRANDALRVVTMEPEYLDYADGSVLITCGKTRVLCAASIETSVPPWMQGRGTGWVTGEYAMLPRATLTRALRERREVSGRTQEIQRLIGRSLRASLNLAALGERMVIVDCDVIQADGGTRTAAITGGYVALALAVRRLMDQGLVQEDVWRIPVAAVSVGILDGQLALDLSYEEDARAEVDLNAVMTAAGDFVEVQGTAEGHPFSRVALDGMLCLAHKGIVELMLKQHEALDVSGKEKKVS